MKEFEKIIGYDAIKAELERIVDMMRNIDKYKSLGVKLPHGILLYGEPGVGKTLFAKCFIEACGVNVFVCRKNKSDGDFVNEIRKIFEQAINNAPAIILLDDMDKFANEDDYHKNADEYVTIQSCIDTIEDKQVLVFATCNSLRNLPDSLLRAGRFESKIKVENPYGEEAVKIVDY